MEYPWDKYWIILGDDARELVVYTRSPLSCIIHACHLFQGIITNKVVKSYFN
jgi:hypothetical protein